MDINETIDSHNVNLRFPNIDKVLKLPLVEYNFLSLVRTSGNGIKIENPILYLNTQNENTHPLIFSLRKIMSSSEDDHIFKSLEISLKQVWDILETIDINYSNKTVKFIDVIDLFLTIKDPNNDNYLVDFLHGCEQLEIHFVVKDEFLTEYKSYASSFTNTINNLHRELGFDMNKGAFVLAARQKYNLVSTFDINGNIKDHNKNFYSKAQFQSLNDISLYNNKTNLSISNKKGFNDITNSNKNNIFKNTHDNNSVIDLNIIPYSYVLNNKLLTYDEVMDFIMELNNNIISFGKKNNISDVSIISDDFLLSNHNSDDFFTFNACLHFLYHSIYEIKIIDNALHIYNNLPDSSEILDKYQITRDGYTRFSALGYEELNRNIYQLFNQHYFVSEFVFSFSFKNNQLIINMEKEYPSNNMLFIMSLYLTIKQLSAPISTSHDNNNIININELMKYNVFEYYKEYINIYKNDKVKIFKWLINHYSNQLPPLFATIKLTYDPTPIKIDLTLESQLALRNSNLVYKGIPLCYLF